MIPDFGEGSDCVVENRFFCTDWVRDNWSGVIQPALLEHVKLMLIAVVIGFAIAFVAAIVTHRYRLTERPFVVFSAIVYTVPSLALFQLLVPVTGLTVATVEIALVGYTLLILYRNILEGLRGVPAGRPRSRARHGAHATTDAVARRAPARGTGDDGRTPRRRRLHDRPRDGRRARRPAGPRVPDLPRARESRSRRRSSSRAGSRSCSRSSPTRCSSSPSARLTPVGARPEDDVIAFDLGIFPGALEFIVDEREADPREDLGSPAPVRGGHGDRAGDRPPPRASGSATCTAARSSPSTSRTSAARSRASPSSRSASPSSASASRTSRSRSSCSRCRRSSRTRTSASTESRRMPSRRRAEWG